MHPVGCQGVNIKFAGSHTASLLALTHGTVDAAEVNSQQQARATKAGQFKASDYREIWKSTPIINDPITVRGDLPAAFQAKVKAALLGLTAAQVSTVDTELGTASNGPMVAATDSLYNPVRAVANAVHLTTAISDQRGRAGPRSRRSAIRLYRRRPGHRAQDAPW